MRSLSRAANSSTAALVGVGAYSKNDRPRAVPFDAVKLEFGTLCSDERAAR